MKIKDIAIDELKPYGKNAKVHPPEQVENLAQSIKDFGWQQPIVIDKNGVIIIGHGRYAAAQRLGLDTVPCIRAEELTEDDVKRLRLLDNKLNESDWDFGLLADELRELNFDDYDLDWELPDSEDQTPEIADDEIPETVEPQAISGGVWRLGQHRLICADCTDSELMAELMAGEKADMVFTDPPYGVAIGDKNKALNEIQRSGRCTENIENDAISESELYEMLVKAFKNVKANAKDDCVYYVTSPQGGSLGLMMMMMMKEAGLEVRHVLMWKKNSPTFSIGRLDYDYQHEPMFYTWTEKHHNYRKGKFRTTVWDVDKPRKCDLHPTMKPIELIANAVLDGTKEGDAVLDVFGGSGSTLIACEQLNRRCFMSEIDPHYCDVIIQRWENLTGQKAERIK